MIKNAYSPTEERDLLSIYQTMIKVRCTTPYHIKSYFCCCILGKTVYPAWICLVIKSVFRMEQMISQREEFHHTSKWSSASGAYRTNYEVKKQAKYLFREKQIIMDQDPDTEQTSLRKWIMPIGANFRISLFETWCLIIDTRTGKLIRQSRYKGTAAELPGPWIHHRYGWKQLHCPNHQARQNNPRPIAHQGQILLRDSKR